jgi:hypothetical protein
MVSCGRTTQAGGTCRHQCKPADGACRQAGRRGGAGRTARAGGRRDRPAGAGARRWRGQARVRAEQAGDAGRGWPTARAGGQRGAGPARHGVCWRLKETRKKREAPPKKFSMRFPLTYLIRETQIRK